MSSIRKPRKKSQTEHIGGVFIHGHTYKISFGNPGKEDTCSAHSGTLTIGRRCSAKWSVAVASGFAAACWTATTSGKKFDWQSYMREVQIGAEWWKLVITSRMPEGKEEASSYADADKPTIYIRRDRLGKMILAAIEAVDSAWKIWQRETLKAALEQPAALPEALPADECAAFKGDYDAAVTKIMQQEGAQQA